ncbi:hypothetical protein AAG570_006703 [Ranatra chinensis]|uniref:DNA polymerase theta n=1 Tax=Ranatra chinensis TaxID=642074 RepID=A0ABD0YUT6_9HEMI
MFPWQVECLTAGNVLSGGNLVYSAPTSAGKTMVAEILAIQTILERKKKVILILPFVSVVREKMVYLQNILAGTGIKVDGFMGTYHPPGGFKLVHLAVCTIEKANSLINRLIEENSMDDVGCVVIDELHLLGDPHRGYLLELLLTKLKYLSERDYASRIQIVGMSATLPNLNVVADWLNATLYSTDFRPIPLTEYVKVGTNIYSSPDLRFSHEIQPTFNVKNDAGDVIYLCIDTLLNGYSAIVFCPTKNWCETLSYQISSEIKRLGFEKNDIGSSLRQQLNSQAIADTLEQLKRCPAGLDKTLARSVSFGVAFHHAGLTLDERDIVEAAFKQNILRVLVATSTLSSGVNLPARRVIIRSPTFYGKCMDILTYKQMIGRAGRMGRDTEGESFLICNEVEKQYGEYLVKSDLPPVESCLGQGGLTSCLKRALLEVIACGIVTSRSEVEQYTKCTLLYVSTNSETIDETISTCIEYLQSNNFIKLRDDGDITASALAEACLSASIQPDQGLKLLKELYKARKCFILHTDLHAIYQVTPYSICDQWAVDWMRVFSVWEDLPDHMRAVGELVGVEDRFLIKAMRSNINMNSSEHLHKISIHKRFYTALALQDLINEVPLKEVSQKYDCNKGMLQSLQQSASTFAGMVHHFCKRLGWGGLEVIVAELSQRIQFGVHRDLLDLLRLDCISAHCARSLFNAGIKTLPDLASAQLRDIENALRKSTPYDRFLKRN